ncbi:hypothetical protein BDV96DRAFT_42207 [Lophiotrema nucula]|uniref:Uncharacterized protein n=1 Tax=Lophiotrema nucula TaxID=690887 RepID=A0A6A5ZCB8_9PLEO|nr:hypothetical protein BDV96DRAFT_42207 [Lophiotrema nucula]
MSTPNSRRSARGGTQTSPAPMSTPKSSALIEPKSEYLRNALEARRAKDITPSPAPATPPVPIQRRVTSDASSVDPWLEQAVSEEEAPKAAPMRRMRRPSEGGIPRLPTQRELQSETEALKQAMFDLNLKLELLKKQNSELKDTLDEANQRIEELEPLEEKNIDLQDDCNRLILRNQTLEDDNAKLEDSNAELREYNAEILKIQEDTVAQMEHLHGALEEAADVIIRSEAANAELKNENARMKAKNGRSEPSQHYYSADDTTSDSSPRKQPPSRIHSIDESRPSTSQTSHFDSDYYSQPASPAVKPKKPSKEGLRFSDRAKTFLELNVKGRRSIQELKKRVSDISMKQSVRPNSPVPEVPQIPESYAAEQTARPVKRTPAKPRPQTAQPPPLDISRTPYRNLPTTPRTPTGPRDGLREMYRSGKSVGSRPSTSSKSPAISKASRDFEQDPNPFLNPPPRNSSRHAQTSSSSEQLRSAHSDTDLSVAELQPSRGVVERYLKLSKPERRKADQDARRSFSSNESNGGSTYESASSFGSY